jgi:hypothetical protein
MMTDTARDDARAVAGAQNRPYPHYLERVDVLLDDVWFSVWVDFEPADRAAGVNATAWAAHVRVGEHFADIVDYLSAETIRRLESEAAEYLSGSD